MKVPFVDLKAQYNSQYNSIKGEIYQTIAQVIENSAFIGSKHVQEFEHSFPACIGVKHFVGVGNGSDAILLL